MADLMTAPYPYGVAVTRQRATVTNDAYGEQLDWSDPDELTIDGCAVAPRTSSAEGDLNAAGRAGVVIGWTLYAPYGADIIYRDRVVLPGVGDTEVEGEPAHWSSPYTGWQPGTVVNLKRVEG